MPSSSTLYIIAAVFAFLAAFVGLLGKIQQSQEQSKNKQKTEQQQSELFDRLDLALRAPTEPDPAVELLIEEKTNELMSFQEADVSEFDALKVYQDGRKITQTQDELAQLRAKETEANSKKTRVLSEPYLNILLAEFDRIAGEFVQNGIGTLYDGESNLRIWEVDGKRVAFASFNTHLDGVDIGSNSFLAKIITSSSSVEFWGGTVTDGTPKIFRLDEGDEEKEFVDHLLRSTEMSIAQGIKAAATQGPLPSFEKQTQSSN